MLFISMCVRCARNALTIASLKGVYIRKSMTFFLLVHCLAPYSMFIGARCSCWWDLIDDFFLVKLSDACLCHLIHAINISFDLWQQLFYLDDAAGEGVQSALSDTSTNRNEYSLSSNYRWVIVPIDSCM